MTQEIGERHAVVLRMFNERSSWKITNDRIDALASAPTGLKAEHASTISTMVDFAIEGGKSWKLTTERYSALHQYLAIVQSPDPGAIKGVVQRMQIGGIRDGVADMEWFVEAMKVLVGLRDSNNV